MAETGYCIFDAKENITPGKLDYVLSKVLRTTCSRYETRYVTLDTQGEKALYEQNDLYTTLKNLPGNWNWAIKKTNVKIQDIQDHQMI